MSSKKVCYIAVHGGAGQHGRTSETQVKGAMKRACAEALQMAFERPHASALSIVELAITILEDEDCLNAGYGSNLTFDGTVECDAALMDGRTGDFGSVGAISGTAGSWIWVFSSLLRTHVPPFGRCPGVRNPIKVANVILAHSRVPDGLGRIRPLTLVSSGARGFAQRHGIDTVDPRIMITPRTQQDWERWMKRYEEASKTDRFAAVPLVIPPEEELQDTVGAIVWDSEGNLAAGVSSGGILLKYSGRIGEAAVFGAGCWAEQSEDGRTGMACSLSGTGEQIMRTGLARAIADMLRPAAGRQDGTETDVHDLLTRTLVTRFCDPTTAACDDTFPHVGILLMTKEARDVGVIPRLWCAFTTESMAVAYASSEKATPKAKLLRRPQASQTGLATNAFPIYITALPLHG